MSKVRAACMIGLAFVCLAIAACSFDDNAKHCEQDPECSPGRCYQGFCIPAPKDTSSSAQTATDAGSKGTSAGKGSQSAGKGGNGGAKPAADAGGDAPKAGSGEGGDCKAGEERPCLVNPDNKTAAESCNRGMQACNDGQWGGCAGKPMPEAEVCNGRDDDCNGEVDDLVELCYPDGQAGCAKNAEGRWVCIGTCGIGSRTCRDGKLSECEGASVPGKDECTPNGVVARDEDCDALTDEGCGCRSGESHPCYSGRSGTMDKGKCVAGNQACTNGTLGACEGEVLDEPETCANPKVDDDCNGVVDDVATLGDTCVVGGAQGLCNSGTLKCSGTTGPSCVSDVMPGAEACNGIDDDCNGRIDETFNLRRDAQNCGTCGHRCAAGEACCGSSCANTTTDNNHCGACGMRCATGTRCSAGKCMPTGMPMAGMPAGGAPPTGGMSGTSGGAGASGGGSGTAGMGAMGCDPACAAGLTCCGGTCIDLMKDPKHCNSCANACSFADSGCCAGKCVDLLDEKTCGACDKDCSLLSNDMITCECKKDAGGTISCTGPVLNVCL